MFKSAIVIAAFLLPTSAVAAELAVVVHPYNQVESVSDKDLKQIYVGAKRFWDEGAPLRIYVRPSEHPAMVELLESVLNTRASRYEAFWTKRQLAGQGLSPESVLSMEDVIATIDREPGAIIIISLDEAQRTTSDRVRILPVGDAELQLRVPDPADSYGTLPLAAPDGEPTAPALVLESEAASPTPDPVPDAPE